MSALGIEIPLNQRKVLDRVSEDNKGEYEDGDVHLALPVMLRTDEVDPRPLVTWVFSNVYEHTSGQLQAFSFNSRGMTFNPKPLETWEMVEFAESAVRSLGMIDPVRALSSYVATRLEDEASALQSLQGRVSILGLLDS